MKDNKNSKTPVAPETAEQNELRVSGIFSKGFGIIPKAVMLCTELTVEAKAIYAYFCSYAGSGNSAFPSRDKIIADLTVSKDTYYKHFDRLVEMGLITVKQERSRQRFFKNIYVLSSIPKGEMIPADEAPSTTAFIELEGNADGFGIMPKLVMTDRSLSIKAKGIYAYFCSFAGAGRVAFPKQKNTLHHLGIDQATYSKHLLQLFAHDYLRFVEQERSGGRFRVRTYVLTQTVMTPAATGTGKVEETGTKKPKLSDTKNWDTENNPDPETKNQKSVRTENAGTKKPKLSDTKTPDTKNSDTNNNSLNNNSINNIYNIETDNSIHPSLNIEVPKDKSDGWTDEKVTEKSGSINDTEQFVLALSGDYEEWADAVRETAEMDFWLNKPCDGLEQELERRVHLLFCDTLVDMLAPRKNAMVIDGRAVPCEEFRSKLSERCRADGKEAIYALQERSCECYIASCNEKEIRKPIPYMRACIWTALLEGDLSLVADIARQTMYVNKIG